MFAHALSVMKRVGIKTLPHGDDALQGIAFRKFSPRIATVWVTTCGQYAGKTNTAFVLMRLAQHGSSKWLVECGEPYTLVGNDVASCKPRVDAKLIDCIIKHRAVHTHARLQRWLTIICFGHRCTVHHIEGAARRAEIVEYGE